MPQPVKSALSCRNAVLEFSDFRPSGLGIRRFEFGGIVARGYSMGTDVGDTKLCVTFAFASLARNDVRRCPEYAG